MARPLTLGIVGTGSVARNAYLPLVASLRARGKVDRVLVADHRQSQLDLVTGAFTVDEATTDPQKVIGDPSVDIVLVLTSMPEHARFGTAALQAGKSVLVEKPMATTLAEGAALLEVARNSPGHLVVAPHVLLSPDFQRALHIVSSGGIGKPILGRARYGWDGPDWGQWFYAPGGGPLFDLGVYNVTSLTALLGPARRVTAMSARARDQRVVDGELIQVQTDDTFQIVLEHDGGALSTVTTAFGIQKYKGAAVEVYGLEGTAQLLGDDWAPDGLEYWSNDARSWQLIESRSRYWPWTNGLSHLVDAVQSGTKPYTTPEHGYHVLEIMLGAMAAADSGQTQDITSTFDPPLPLAPVEDQSHRIHDRVHENAL